MTSRSLLAPLAAVLACGPSPQTAQLNHAVAAALARQTAETTVAFRFTGGRAGDVRMYLLPTLEEITWRFTTPELSVRHVVGFRRDTDEILLIGAGRNLIVLDLQTGRPRTADSNVVVATLGPMGRPLSGRGDGSVAQISGRRANLLADSLGGTIVGVWGTTGGRTLVELRGARGRELVLVAAEQRPERVAIPEGPLAVTPFGEAAAVATDSGIVFYRLEREPEARFTKLTETPVALAISASGHRIYVATGTDALVTLDRFSLTELDRRRLPIAVSALRVEESGRFLLARASEHDSILAISLQGTDPPVLIHGGWDTDLPAAAADGTVLVRRDDAVVALALPDFREIGSAERPTVDRWLIAPWDPRRPALQLASEQRAAALTPGDQRFYVQVSSTTNLEWADALATDLQRAGMKSAVLPPDELIEMYRVVIGPYPARDEAEEIGRTLGMPYWIFTETRQPGAP